MINKIIDHYYTFVDDVRDFIDNRPWLQLKMARLAGYKMVYIHKALCHYGYHSFEPLSVDGEWAILICIPCGAEKKSVIIEVPKKMNAFPRIEE